MSRTDSPRYAPRRQREQRARDLKPIYTATDADAASEALERFDERWGARFPVITQAWRGAWEQVIPFLSFSPEVRRVIYTTDEKFKGAGASTSARGGVSVRGGRGRPRSEAQDLGLVPAAQRLPPFEGLESRAPLAAATPVLGALACQSATIWV